ncbi:MAG: gamma-glutamyl-gamma-aminobutyrate hydrolase family protein, partial [Flavobacteriales bacterium]
GIATHFGAGLTNLPEVMHGRETKVEVTDDSEILFSGIDPVFSAGLYHSWAVEDAGLPSCLKVTARSPEGIIMAISHRELDVKGVQFHPESIMTPAGKKIMSNWLGVS